MQNKKGGMIQRESGVWIRDGFHEDDTRELARLARKYRMHGSLQSWGETIYNMTVDGPVNTAGTAASMLASPKITLTERFWSMHKAVRISAWGRMSSVITTPGTARFDVRQPSPTIIWDSLAVLLDTVAAHVTMPWRLMIDLVCRAEGATGNLFGSGEFKYEGILGTPATMPKGSLTAMLPWNTAPVVSGNFDTAPANALDVFFTQTVATGSMTCHGCTIESLN